MGAQGAGGQGQVRRRPHLQRLLAHPWQSLGRVRGPIGSPGVCAYSGTTVGMDLRRGRLQHRRRYVAHRREPSAQAAALGAWVAHGNLQEATTKTRDHVPTQARHGLRGQRDSQLDYVFASADAQAEWRQQVIISLCVPPHAPRVRNNFLSNQETLDRLSASTPTPHA